MVKPAMSVARRWLVARATRSPSGSRSTWSSQLVSLYGCSSTCECRSISPGMSVAPGRSITRAVRGAFTAAGVPTATIRSPRTSTTTPVRGASAVPSQTRSGRSRTTAAESARGACARAAGTNAAASAATRSAMELFMTGKLRDFRGGGSTAAARPGHPVAGTPTSTGYEYFQTFLAEMYTGGEPPARLNRSSATSRWRVTMDTVT